jgi:SAM-dependent methyltransferase
VASEFDQFADTYDADLNRALSVSGEDKGYFARGRVDWLRRCLLELGQRPVSAIDYGCGLGDTSTLLQAELKLESVVGLDVSARLLDLARVERSSEHCHFMRFDEYVPQERVDLVYCNGVFHHIPVAERAAAVEYIRRCLRPGGLFALWENNPWNPGTRYVMSRCTFDRDAIPIVPPEATRLLKSWGFQVLRVNFLFFFPRVLRALRVLEPHLRRIPVGAQYQVLCRKSGS